MTNLPSTFKILCGINENDIVSSTHCEKTILLTRNDMDGQKANFNVMFDKFITDISELSPSVIDLLEIATYVFEADRASYRGARDSLSNNSWARTFEFHIPVRELSFWDKSSVKIALKNALEFMTGDKSYSFNFYSMKFEMKFENLDPQMSLFSLQDFEIQSSENSEIALFSGGLDSFAGVIEYLSTKQGNNLCVISHQSSNMVIKTQSVLLKEINKRFNNRMKMYKFKCTSKKELSTPEESQRTRMFLFSSIAYAISSYYRKNKFFFFENGMTSINLPKQYDVMHARASRTTHPKTIGTLQKFFKQFNNDFSIEAPYIYKTKTDIVEIIKQSPMSDLLNSSVSCSSTRNVGRSTTHCGICSQCIDRRFAIFASDMYEYDEGVYDFDFIINGNSDEGKQRLYNTLRMAINGNSMCYTEFLEKYLNEITDIIEFSEEDADDAAERFFELFKRHCRAILVATKRIAVKFDDVSIKIPPNSFMEMISSREYLKEPYEVKVERLNSNLVKAIPTLFFRERPKNETDFNSKIRAILEIDVLDVQSEYPIIRFGLSNYIPDHSTDTLLIESKYIRGSTSPSVVNEGIAADIVKAPNECGLFFVVYDPERKISNDERFISAFENKRRSCFVRIYR